MTERLSEFSSGPGHSDDFSYTTIGTRQACLPGLLRPPTAQERAWVREMANRGTRVPKGVFRYRTIEAANADWERWCVELVATTVSPSR
jgi:hypothetical protein